MIKAYKSDITKLEDIEYICNAANAVGPMGAGVAGAIRRAGGDSIQMEAFKICKRNNIIEGEVYVTKAGTLPYKNIVHLVTMKQPGGNTSYNIIRKCLQNLIILCKAHGITKIALPALGTGIGGLHKDIVASIFIENLNIVPDIEFHIVDIDDEFINLVNEVRK